jgi:hypothetical protein
MQTRLPTFSQEGLLNGVKKKCTAFQTPYSDVAMLPFLSLHIDLLLYRIPLNISSSFWRGDGYFVISCCIVSKELLYEEGGCCTYLPGASVGGLKTEGLSHTISANVASLKTPHSSLSLSTPFPTPLPVI